ncbi:MAG: imidazole glycerol phosphate synthase subunit HisH [Spirochaetia bacterium]
MKVTVIDYDAGNLRSVETALTYLGLEYVVSSKPEDCLKAEKILFPGVGEAKAAMGVLQKQGLDSALKEAFKKGTPILGICLGSQIVMDYSQEGNAECLGLIPGKAVKFPEIPGCKVPHMGWNTVEPVVSTPLFSDIPHDTSFYFVHSYYPKPENSSFILCETEYGIKFASGIKNENCTAFQFHPEKSGVFGLKLLYSFIAGKE